MLSTRLSTYKIYINIYIYFYNNVIYTTLYTNKSNLPKLSKRRSDKRNKRSRFVETSLSYISFFLFPSRCKSRALTLFFLSFQLTASDSFHLKVSMNIRNKTSVRFKRRIGLSENIHIIQP